MPEQPPAWEVTGQMETVDLGPAGTFVNGVKVTFRTREGAIGSVFVPQDAYTVARVREAVDRQAAVLRGVSGLTAEG